MKFNFCGNIHTAVYLTKEGLPCAPGRPFIIKSGDKAALLVVHPVVDEICVNVPVELGDLKLPDGSYALANGVATYADGLLTLSYGSTLVEI